MRSRFQIWRGCDSPPPPLRELKAGPVTAMLDGIDLRYIRWGSTEVVRRVYVAVRDPEWNTLPCDFRMLRTDVADDRFVLEFVVRHESDDIHYVWTGRIVGTADGTIRYAMDGEALSDFQYNRIGICVLHPDEVCAGKFYRGGAGGTVFQGRLPEHIGAQRFENGRYVALTEPFDHLSIQVQGNIEVKFDFTGDLFEIEDQRNWVDASFKTYCTPLRLGVPHRLVRGAHLAQSVSVGVKSQTPAARQASDPGRELSVGAPLGKRLPAIGFRLSDRPEPWEPREVERLRLAAPDHLRIDLTLVDDEYENTLRRGMQAAADLDCALEIGLHYSEHSADRLGKLASMLRDKARVARWLIFMEGARSAHASETTPAHLIELARERLSSSVGRADFVGGTDMNFAELNRTRPVTSVCDAICYSIAAQVHAFDDFSMSETFSGQGATVRSAQTFSGGLPVVVSPITLKPRSNLFAIEGRENKKKPDHLPDSVDPRQLSLYGAVWTLGSIKALSEQGAASLTYYETTGWSGLMEHPQGSPLPGRFPSTPGMIYPLYAVFADLAEWKQAEMLAMSSSHPLELVGIALKERSRTLLLIGNLTGSEQAITVRSIPGEEAAVRFLDETSVDRLQADPAAFRCGGEPGRVEGGRVELRMKPYGLAKLVVATAGNTL